MSNITDLPPELLILLFGFLDTWDLLCVRQVGIPRLEQVARSLLPPPGATHRIKGLRNLKQMLESPNFKVALKISNFLTKVDLDPGQEKIDSYEQVEQVQDLSTHVRDLTLRNLEMDLHPTQFLFRNLSRSVQTLTLTNWRHCYCAALHFTSSRELKRIRLDVDDASACNILYCTIRRLCEDKRRKNLVKEAFTVVDKSTRAPAIAKAEVSPCELLF